MANTFKFGNGNWAVKDGYALAYNDENNNFKPLPFDFTRASSATRVNKQGLIETVPSGKPRIDFTDNTSGHLLLEPSRTNLITYSEDFSDSSWIKSGPSLTYNQGTSPDGENNATKMIPSTSSTSQDIFATVTASGSTAYTRSFFAKADGYNWIYIQQYDGSTNRGAWFDLSTGSLGNTETNVTSSIENFGNGWYKCSVTFTTQSGATSERAQIRVVGSNGATTFAGNGTDGVLIWGAMVEQGSYATSYIPTEGSSVTRVVEIDEQTPPDGVIGQTEGSVYVEFDYLNSTGERRFIFQLGTGGDTIYARIESGQTLTSQILNSGSGLTSSGTAIPSGNNKLAIAYASNDAVIYLNGSQIAVTSSITIPSLDDVYVGHNSGGSQQIAGAIKDFRLYNTALTDTELQNLTS
ncbi:hypothetical protein OAP45_02780 [Candidatus Pelagibacter sp.]|nr:hypothetical protein [Candidatus Pelagibacter sp.]